MHHRPLHLVLATGHTASSALALSHDFRAIAAVQGMSFYLHAYPPHLVAFRAGETLTRLATRLGIGLAELQRRTERMVVCVPGGAKRRDQAQVRECLNKIQWISSPSRVTVVDDTWSGLAAGTMSQFGTCAFAGTGASVFVGLGRCSLEDRQEKFDGWGSIIGDFGSAFQLSVDMFRYFNRHVDARKRPPPLFNLVLEKCPDIESIDNVQRWFDAVFISDPYEWRLRLAGLARVLTEEGDKPNGDPDAKRLVRAAAKEMAATLAIAMSHHPKARQYPIVFQGGMFEHSSLYRHAVISRSRALTKAGFVLAKYRPIVGATLMFQDMTKTQARNFIESVSCLQDGEMEVLLRTRREAAILRPNNLCYV